MSRGVAGGIFLSYRRVDSAHFTARLASQLSRSFGRSRVFFDTDRTASLAAGDQWPEVLRARASSAEVLLLVIGSRWLEPDPETGLPHVYDSTNWCHQEVKAALEAGAVVVPVLLDGQSMPREEELPAPIRGLVNAQAYKFSSDHFDRDSGALVRELQRHVLDDRSPPRRFWDRYSRKLTPALLSIGVVASLFIGLWPTVEQQEQMDGTFNVAVAGFDEFTDLTPALSENAGTSVANAVAALLREELPEDTLVWGPAKLSDTVDVGAADVAGRKSRAHDLAAEVGADILVYGTIDPGEIDGRVSISLEAAVRGADERRPADPIVFERSIGRPASVDPARLDSADDARARLPGVALLADMVEALRFLDRSDPLPAAELLQATGSQEPGVQALLGVALLRAGEQTENPSHMTGALQALRSSVRADSSFEFAELWLLGARYVEALGGPGSSLENVHSAEDRLLQIRSELVNLQRDAPPKSLVRYQAANVATQIDLVLYGIDPDEARLSQAAATLRELEAEIASRNPLEPEFRNVLVALRSNIGLVAAEQRDWPQALRWYEAARSLASPHAFAVESAKLGVVYLEIGDGAAAGREFCLALAELGADGTPVLEGALRAEVEDLQARANSGTPCV